MGQRYDQVPYSAESGVLTLVQSRILEAIERLGLFHVV